MDERTPEQVIRENARRWPSSIVTRSAFKQFSGGLYSAGTLANLDSQGLGPAGAFKIGRQQVYPVDSVVEWLIKRLGKHASNQQSRE